jgi:hypothetical protein
VPNNGKQLKWLRNGAMEVMVSLNFFRHVVPQEYQHLDSDMRQWLINHDYISGFKKQIVIPTNIGAFMTSRLDRNLVEWKIYNTPWKDDKSKTKRVLKIWLKGQKEKGSFELVADTNFENTEFNGEYSVHFKTYTGVHGDDKLEASTKEERDILFEQLEKAIPDGAKISTWGSVSKGGVYGLSKLARIGNWIRTEGFRAVTSKESKESMSVPVYQKQDFSGEDKYYDYKDEDKQLISILNTSL